MVVVVFRARMRPGAEAELTRLGARMYQLASAMPGFISYKDFISSDGEAVSIVEFATLEDSARWREQPEHRAAQELGRGTLLSTFRVQVCELVRESRYP